MTPIPEAPSLTFVGTGEALDPALANTSMLVRGARTLLLDCGYSVPHALWRLTQDPDLLDGVWISHAHADHCFGLPALLLWMRLQGRARPLTLLGGPGSRARLEQVLELGYPGSYAAHKCYAIEFVEVAASVSEAATTWGPLTLRAAASTHSVANYAVRVEAPGQRSLMYSGDGAPTPGTRALARGVSTLVHECFSAAPSRKHGDVDGCVALAADAGVEVLALLHFAAEAKLELRTRATQLARDQLGDRVKLVLPQPGDRLSLAPGIDARSGS